MKNTDEDVAKNQDLTWDTNTTADNIYDSPFELISKMAELKGQHTFFSFFLSFPFLFAVNWFT